MLKNTNNKGFTLVELLVTLVLLSLITTIAVTGVVEVLNTSRKSEYKILINNIESAAKMFYEDCNYGVLIGDKECSNTVSIGKMVELGYLKGNNEKNVINPLNDKILNDININIEYEYDGKSKKYKIVYDGQSLYEKLKNEGE